MLTSGLAESFAVFAAVRSHLRDDFAPNDREVCNNAVNQLACVPPDLTPSVRAWRICVKSRIVLRCSGDCRVRWGWCDTPDCGIVRIPDKVAVHSS